MIFIVYNFRSSVDKLRKFAESIHSKQKIVLVVLNLTDGEAPQLSVPDNIHVQTIKVDYEQSNNTLGIAGGLAQQNQALAFANFDEGTFFVENGVDTMFSSRFMEDPNIRTHYTDFIEDGMVRINSQNRFATTVCAYKPVNNERMFQVLQESFVTIHTPELSYCSEGVNE